MSCLRLWLEQPVSRKYFWYGVNLIKYDMRDRFIYMDVMQTIGDIRAGLVSLTIEQVHFNKQLLLVVMSDRVLPVLWLSNIPYVSHAITYKPGMCDGHSSSSNFHPGPQYWRVHFLLCLIAYLPVIAYYQCLEMPLCLMWYLRLSSCNLKTFELLDLLFVLQILIWEV